MTGEQRCHKRYFANNPPNLTHNNLGYCLNALERLDDVEPYCRTAIEIEGTRPHAFKDLHIALAAQQWLEDVAECHITAKRVNASDRRGHEL